MVAGRFSGGFARTTRYASSLPIVPQAWLRETLGFRGCNCDESSPPARTQAPASVVPQWRQLKIIGGIASAELRTNALAPRVGFGEAAARWQFGEPQAHSTFSSVKLLLLRVWSDGVQAPPFIEANLGAESDRPPPSKLIEVEAAKHLKAMETEFWLFRVGKGACLHRADCGLVLSAYKKSCSGACGG